jgi:hypothetical protein
MLSALRSVTSNLDPDPLPMGHAFPERSSRGERRPKPETLHECRRVFRSELAAVGTGSTKRRFVQPPSAIAPAHCHVRRYAWQA